MVGPAARGRAILGAVQGERTARTYRGPSRPTRPHEHGDHDDRHDDPCDDGIVGKAGHQVGRYRRHDDTAGHTSHIPTLAISSCATDRSALACRREGQLLHRSATSARSMRAQPHLSRPHEPQRICRMQSLAPQVEPAVSTGASCRAASARQNRSASRQLRRPDVDRPLPALGDRDACLGKDRSKQISSRSRGSAWPWAVANSTSSCTFRRTAPCSGVPATVMPWPRRSSI